jgi:hypothetical protein
MLVRALLHTALAWLLPGLGHAVQGRLAKALYFGALVLATYAVGVALGEGGSVSADRYPFHLYGQYGAGLPAFVARSLGSAPLGHTVDRLELGVVMTTVAGILNVIVMVDCYEWERRRSEGA